MWVILENLFRDGYASVLVATGVWRPKTLGIQGECLDGAEFVFGRTIEKITSEGPVFRVAVFDDKDAVIGFEEERELVEADCTIIAVSQGPKDKLVTTTRSLESTDQGLLIVDDKFMTTREGVFAAGDVVHGSKTVVHAVEDAKNAARAMMEYMEKETDVC